MMMSTKVKYVIYASAVIGAVYSTLNRLIKRGQVFIKFKMSPRNRTMNKHQWLFIALKHKRTGTMYYSFECVRVRYATKFDLGFFKDKMETLINTAIHDYNLTRTLHLSQPIDDFMSDYQVKLVYFIPHSYEYFYIGEDDAGSRIKDSNNMLSLWKRHGFHKLDFVNLTSFFIHVINEVGDYYDTNAAAYFSNRLSERL